MSGEAVKAYMYLLCEAWLQTPRATLPNSDPDLASMARNSIADWDRIKIEVMARFKLGECEEHLGRFYNEKQLDVSRNYESNQRFGNKNAKQTRIKRETNAKKRILSASASASASATSITDKKERKTPTLFYMTFEKFTEKLGDSIPKEQHQYWFGQAEQHSNKGNKAINWILSVRGWHRKTPSQYREWLSKQPPSNRPRVS
jgi:uncharacterized protein YdaU (DUF1376 family)